MCLALVAKGVPYDSLIVDVPLEVKNLLDDFIDMVPDEFPSELPPLRDIQHAIYLVPGSQLPNSLHYRMNPKARKELNRQQGVWDLILPTNEFSYNNFVNHSTGKSPFQIVNGYWPRPHTH